MSRNFARNVGVELDTIGVEQLMAAIRGANVEPISMRSRLREFLKRDFPEGARAGQGKRASYGIGELHEVAIALELADLGLSSPKSISLVQQNKWVLRRVCTDAFDALRTAGGDLEARARRLRSDRQPYQLLVAPTGVTHDKGAYVAFGSDGSMPLGSPLRHSRLTVDVLTLVADIGDALAGDGFRYRQAEIDQAYVDWAIDAHGEDQVGEWTKGELLARDLRIAR